MKSLHYQKKRLAAFGVLALLVASLVFTAAMPALGQGGPDDECIWWDDYGNCLLWESQSIDKTRQYNTD